MYDLPEGLQDLSAKRQKEIASICVQERKDAALNAVVIGLKALNHLYGMGLQRLSRLTLQWGEDIINFYSKGGELPGGEFPTGFFAGDAICNVQRRFFDLSERRQREIARFLREQREDAQYNAATIGVSAIRRELGFGDTRISRLADMWQHDILNFYQEREIYEPRLTAWMEDIGFSFEDGKLQTYRCCETGKLIKKSTAERWQAEGEDA